MHLLLSSRPRHLFGSRSGSSSLLSALEPNPKPGESLRPAWKSRTILTAVSNLGGQQSQTPWRKPRALHILDSTCRCCSIRSVLSARLLMQIRMGFPHYLIALGWVGGIPLYVIQADGDWRRLRVLHVTRPASSALTSPSAV